MKKAERVKITNCITIITSARDKRSISDVAKCKIEELVKNTYYLYDAVQHWPPRGVPQRDPNPDVNNCSIWRSAMSAVNRFPYCLGVNPRSMYSAKR